MCLHKSLIYIKLTRNLNQPECNYSMVDRPTQSSHITKGNYTTTTEYTVDGNEHIQGDKYVYTKVFLELELLDKLHVNRQYQCLPPLACLNIQQLGQHRRGKEEERGEKGMLISSAYAGLTPKKLVRVSIEVNINK